MAKVDTENLVCSCCGNIDCWAVIEKSEISVLLECDICDNKEFIKLK